jgi:hypothetical protein
MNTHIVTSEDRLPDGFARGEVEIIIKDRQGRLYTKQVEHNIVKIFSKEILAHRMPFSKVWDPTAGTGSGAWVPSGIDPLEEFAPKYILLGASFDANHIALDANDPRYYTQDPVTGQFVPNLLGPGAEFQGELINAIPLAEPFRPIKRIEKIDFIPTYQPSGTPLLQADVRAMNNIVTLETVLTLSEYNGFGASDGDFFTITEVALAAGKEIDISNACNATPRDCFLDGRTSDGKALLVHASGTDVISIDPSETDVDLIKAGDQIKLVSAGGSVDALDTLNQTNPFYLVMAKAPGGRDITLDRPPVDSSNVPLVGTFGVFRDTLRIFSHRILSSPVKKSNNFEITIRWKIIFN